MDTDENERGNSRRIVARPGFPICTHGARRHHPRISAQTRRCFAGGARRGAATAYAPGVLRMLRLAFLGARALDAGAIAEIIPELARGTENSLGRRGQSYARASRRRGGALQAA